MLGMLYAEDKVPDKAIFHAKAALALAPSDPWILADVAETYEDLGDRKTAIEYALKSLHNGYSVEDLQKYPALHNLLADTGFRAHVQHPRPPQ